MDFPAFKALVESRPDLQVFSGPLAKSRNWDRLRHNMVVMLDCDQWAIDVVEFAQADDVAKLAELAHEIAQSRMN